MEKSLTDPRPWSNACCSAGSRFAHEFRNDIRCRGRGSNPQAAFAAADFKSAAFTISPPRRCCPIAQPISTWRRRAVTRAPRSYRSVASGTVRRRLTPPVTWHDRGCISVHEHKAEEISGVGQFGQEGGEARAGDRETVARSSETLHQERSPGSGSGCRSDRLRRGEAEASRLRDPSLGVALASGDRSCSRGGVGIPRRSCSRRRRSSAASLLGSRRDSVDRAASAPAIGGL
jgi:hypothetical protein